MFRAANLLMAVDEVWRQDTRSWNLSLIVVLQKKKKFWQSRQAHERYYQHNNNKYLWFYSILSTNASPSMSTYFKNTAYSLQNTHM